MATRPKNSTFMALAVLSGCEE
jgi:hypothetical protein